MVFLNPWYMLLLNTTFWAALLVLSIAAGAWLRFGHTSSTSRPAVGILSKLLTSTPLLGFLVLGSLGNIGFVFYMSYVAPTDVMQDVFMADQLLRDEPIYTSNLRESVRKLLKQDPPRLLLGGLWERLRQKEILDTQWIVQMHSHPPPMAFLFAPLVALFGTRGAVLSFNITSLMALFVTLLILYRVLTPDLSRRLAVAVGFGALGWQPIIDLVRQGQNAIVLGILLVLGWYHLRNGREYFAGIAIGVATSLMFYPGLLLFYLLLRHRRAFFAGALTVICLLGASLPVVGWQAYFDYFRKAGNVVHFAWFIQNLSLLGPLARAFGPKLGANLFMAAAAGVLLFLALLLRKIELRKSDTARLDVEYALFVALVPVLSPIAWDHYLSILLLPLAYLGKEVFRREPPWTDLLGYLSLLVVFSIPAYTFYGILWIRSAPGAPSGFWSFLAAAPHTFATLALPLWLIWTYCRDLRRKTAVSPAVPSSLRGEFS